MPLLASGEQQQGAAQLRVLLAKAAAEHLHRRHLGQFLPEGQGALRQQQRLHPQALRLAEGGIQAAQQGLLLVELKFAAGGDGRLQHQQLQSLTIRLKPLGALQTPPAQPLHGHHQRQPQQPQPPGLPAPAPHRQPQPPQAPADQQLQAGHTARPQPGGPGRQRPITRQGRRPQADPEQRTAGQQHLHQPPQRRGEQGHRPALSPQPLHQPAPAPHQGGRQQATTRPEQHAQRQAQGQGHPHPIQGVEPQQPAVAHQHRHRAPEASGGRPQPPQRHEGQPQQGWTAQGGQGHTRQRAPRQGRAPPPQRPVAHHGHQP